MKKQLIIAALAILSFGGFVSTSLNAAEVTSKNSVNSSQPNTSNGHVKGWAKNQNNKWIWYTGNGNELYNKPGWQSYKGKLLFGNADKSYATKEWKKIKGVWYWFDKNGYVNTNIGWEKLKSGKWVYSGGSKGYYTNITVKIGTKSYRFDANSYLVK